MSKQYYTTHEVSRFFNVYPTTVINWIEAGLLSAFTTPGGHRRIKKEDIIKLIKKNNMPLPDELMRDSQNKVLIVDDDPKISRMVKTILEAEDLEVLTAKSGLEAGFIISEKRPDIILLDFLMPEMDGFEACRRLRSDEKTKDIPIIAITVLRDQKEIKRMYAYGITDYLSKPFKADELIEKVKKYIVDTADIHK